MDDGDHGVRDSRGPRLETRKDERVWNKRQQFREVNTEGRHSHQSRQFHQGGGVGGSRPGDRGYYGPGTGGTDHRGREGRAPRVTPASHQRVDPEHDFKGRVAHGKHREVSGRGGVRSRPWSRPCPQLGPRSRSGSPPPIHGSDKRFRSTSSGKSPSRTQTRCEAMPWIVLCALRPKSITFVAFRPSRILVPPTWFLLCKHNWALSSFEHTLKAPKRLRVLYRFLLTKR